VNTRKSSYCAKDTSNHEDSGLTPKNTASMFWLKLCLMQENVETSARSLLRKFSVTLWRRVWKSKWRCDRLRLPNELCRPALRSKAKSFTAEVSGEDKHIEWIFRETPFCDDRWRKTRATLMMPYIVRKPLGGWKLFVAIARCFPLCEKRFSLGWRGPLFRWLPPVYFRVKDSDVCRICRTVCFPESDVTVWRWWRNFVNNESKMAWL